MMIEFVISRPSLTNSYSIHGTFHNCDPKILGILEMLWKVLTYVPAKTSPLSMYLYEYSLTSIGN